MSEKYTGWIGWSNKRVGLEIYHSAEDGRHNHDERYHGYGHLLVHDFHDGMEGRKVVVIVGDDRAEEPDGVWVTEDSLAKALDAVTTDGWPDDQYDFDGTIPEFAAAIIQAAKEAER